MAEHVVPPLNGKPYPEPSKPTYRANYRDLLHGAKEAIRDFLLQYSSIFLQLYCPQSGLTVLV